MLVNKHAGVSSFGVIEILQRALIEKTGARKRDLPKMGHGGTLDPFATGLLTVCVGRAVKLARYFLGSTKTYEGVILFGRTTTSGDPTTETTGTTGSLPADLETIQGLARVFTLQPYLQTPPMHSAKKKDGKPLYELAHAGIEIEREEVVRQIHSFEILSYEKPRATFRVVCSSGTYVRTLVQDLARMGGSLALLESLTRTAAGSLNLTRALGTDAIATATQAGTRWDELACWVPFDLLLEGYDRAEASPDEARSLRAGQQNVLFSILKRVEAAPSSNAVETREQVAIYTHGQLVAVANRSQNQWGIERVFTQDES